MAASPVTVADAAVAPTRAAVDTGRHAELWLSLLFVSLLLLPPFPFPLGNAGGHIAPFVLLLGAPAAIRRMAANHMSMRGLPGVLLLFLGVLFVTTPFAAVFSGWKVALGSLVRVCLFGVGVYVFFYTLKALPDNEWRPARFARFLFWVALAGAAFACVDFYFQFHVPAGFAMQVVWLKSGAMRRAQGLFYESSTLGNFCAFFLVLIMVAAFPLRGQRRWQAYMLIPGALIFATALILSGSRAAVVSVVTAGAVFVTLRRVKIAGIVAIVAACLAAGAVVRAAVPAFWSNYWFRLTGSTIYLWSYPNEVLSGRLANWKILTDFLARHPWQLLFGIGYKTIPYTRYIGGHVVADNTWLSLLVETGVAGVAVFAALNIAILRTSYRAVRSSRPQAAFFGAWMLCFWCGEMVQMLTADVITYWRVLPLYFWVLATALRESKA